MGFVATRNVKIGNVRLAPGDPVPDGLSKPRLDDLRFQGLVEEEGAFRAKLEAAQGAESVFADVPGETTEKPAKKNKG